jgi:hypothetical protein
MPLISRIPQDHPGTEILRLLRALEIPDDVTLTVSENPNLNGPPRWEIKLMTATRVGVRSVEEQDGPAGVLMAASQMLAEVGRPSRSDLARRAHLFSR